MNGRRRKAGFLAAVLLIVGAVAYVARPAGHIPPYDANLVRLAETDLQGYCAGRTFWNTQGLGNAGVARACRSELREQHPDVPDLPAAERGFCQAISDQGWAGTVGECLDILVANQYWPTYDGSLSNQWNRARPYPHVAATLGSGPRSDDSRTGSEHGGGDRPTGTDLRRNR